MNKLKDLLECRKEIKLDLGCGPRKKSPEFIGIDISRMPGVDLNINLEEAKLPFQNNSVDQINASHILEHIRNYLPLVEEIWRVLKPGAKFEVAVPHYKHESAFTDPTHVRLFTRKSFHLFDERKVPFNETGWYMSLARFRINKVAESEREITYDLTAQKRRVLLVGPSSSIHTKRWKDFISSKSHLVTLASRVKKGYADIQLGNPIHNRETQIKDLPNTVEGLLGDNSYDIVHVNFATRYGHVLTRVPKNLRRILSVWGEDVLYEAEIDSKNRERLLGGLKNADFITTTSEHMSDILQKKYNIDKRAIWVIPWGYTLYTSEGSQDIRKKLSLPSGKLLLSARACRPLNNIETIIESFRGTSQEGNLIILTGELSDREYVAKLKKQNEDCKVYFLPTLSETDLCDLYKESTAILSFPHVDQLSTTLLEALACGTPVICSDIQPYSERIVSGYNGYLISPKDQRKLTSIIQLALDDPDFKEKMSRNAKESVKSDSWEENSIRLIKLYDAPLDYDKPR